MSSTNLANVYVMGKQDQKTITDKSCNGDCLKKTISIVEVKISLKLEIV